MTIDISTLLSRDTAAVVAAKGLQVAQALGLPVSSWRTGDPTKSLYSYLARVLAGVDGDDSEPGLAGLIVGYGQAAFLSLSSGDWLTVLAHEVYGVDRVLAVYAPTTVTVNNGGGGYYNPQIGDLTFKNSITGQTYHSTSVPLSPTTGLPIGPLSAGVTAVFTVVADVAGSAGSSATNGIDTLVTTLLGVTVTGSAAAVGVDQQSDPDLRTQCRSTLGALSPNGPPDAYEFVCRNSALTGVNDITRAKSIATASDGSVIVYVAGAAGTVAGASLTAAQAAVLRWATPLCITSSVQNATPVTVNVVATISGTNIPTGYAVLISTALGATLSAFGIAGATGDVVDTTLLTAAMRAAAPAIKLVTMTVPAAPVALAAGQFPVIGTVSITLV